MEWIKVLLLVSSTYVAVVDGDTVRLNDGGANVRLEGFNTPETYTPKCAQEKALGEAAKARLGAIIKQSDVALAIRPGSCGYGRRCGTVTVDGRNVGEILISEGLAEPMVCLSGGRCPPARNWC